MDILDVNRYLNNASENLQDTAEYQRWFKALVESRKEADICGFDASKLEAIMYQIYVQKIAYILDDKDRVDAEKHIHY